MRIAVVGMFVLMLILGFGCSDKNQTPSGVIPRNEMEKIIWDMMEADQYASTYVLKDSAHTDVKQETLKLYQQVFQLHKISREDFSKSYAYYQSHPDVARNMFDSLLARGNRMRTEFYSRPQGPPPSPSVPITHPSAPPPGHQGPALLPHQPVTRTNGGRGVLPPGMGLHRPDSTKIVRPGTVPGKFPRDLHQP